MQLVLEIPHGVGGLVVLLVQLVYGLTYRSFQVTSSSNFSV